MTSSQYGPYGQDCTRTTMPGTMGSDTVRWSKSPKTGPSSDCRLQLAGMKLESLVWRISYGAVNTFPGLVHTARHIMKAGCTRSRRVNPQGGQVPKVWLVIGMKS